MNISSFETKIISFAFLKEWSHFHQNTKWITGSETPHSHLEISPDILGSGVIWIHASIACCSCLCLPQLDCESCREFWALTEASACNPSCPHPKAGRAIERMHMEATSWLMARLREAFPAEESGRWNAGSRDKCYDSLLDSLCSFSSHRPFFLI